MKDEAYFTTLREEMLLLKVKKNHKDVDLISRMLLQNKLYFSPDKQLFTKWMTNFLSKGQARQDLMPSPSFLFIFYLQKQGLLM